MITFTTGSPNDQGAEMSYAQAYLDAASRGVDAEVLENFRKGFTETTHALVKLGTVLGSPVVLLAINPRGESA